MTGEDLLSFAFTDNSTILREMSSCCSISACSHQLKSSEGKEGLCVVLIGVAPCGITGNEESRVQVLPGVETPSLKTTVKASHPFSPPLQAIQIREADFLLSSLAAPSLVGWQCPSSRKGL